LQGDLSQVGHVFQCPMCGSSFVIPPPQMGPVAAGGFFQQPGTWPAASAPMASFPAQGGMPAMPGMMPPQTMPMMPSGPMPAGQYPMPPVQPFAFGPATAPAETPQQAPATDPQSETGKPGFDLGFDPNAKATLPFEIEGQSEAEAGQPPATGLPTPAFPAPAFPASTFPAPSFPGPAFPAPGFPAQPFPEGAPPAATFFPPSMPAPTFQPDAGGEESLPFAMAAPAEAAEEEEEAPQNPPKVLHIRCPSGHLVTAKSNLLGKNGRCPACKKTFELRYEDSVEFRRRTEKILHREEVKAGSAWVAWALLAAFLVLVGVVAVMLALSR